MLHRIAVCVTLSVGLAAGTTRAAAQTAPSPPPVREQVEVVATRLPEPPQEVSIEVIDGDTLLATGATTLRDALAPAAGDKRNRALTPAFAAIDGGVGCRLDRWEIRVDGRNLGDRRDAVWESELGDAQYHLLSARRVDATAAVWF